VTHRTVALLLGLALTASLGGCGEGRAPAPEPRCQPLARSEPAARRDVIFVLSDTTRRDRLGVYGGPARTPHVDALARDGIVLTAATTQAPWTKPAIATLFTGLPPSAHGAISHPSLRREGGSDSVESDRLGDRHATLAESLAAAGYETAAFVSNPWIQRRLGFDQGFEVWDESFSGNATPGEVVTRAGLRWLRERRVRGDERPFFLYLHYMDAHSPFHPVRPEAVEARRAELEADERPLDRQARGFVARVARDPQRRPWVSRGLEPNRALFELVYDQGVERFDRAFGALVAGLREQGRLGDTAILLTSDHGEALYEHGWASHGHGLHAQETGVPLVARLPGVEEVPPISCPVGLIDLRRTLCDYLGVECLGGDDRGVSLFSPALADPGRVVLVGGVIGRPRNRAARDARYKLLYEPDGRSPKARPDGGGPIRLYDLARDPAETRFLDADEIDGEALAAFERLRAAARESAAAPPVEAESVELDEATRRRLEALGYVDPEP